MTKSKLTLPFRQACKLTEPQKCKLIECQARRVAIEEWEIKALLEICLEHGWIDKGLAVLYEYAGYMDRFKRKMDDHSVVMENVVDLITSINQNHGVNNLTLLHSAVQHASMLLVQTLHTVCCWRRLQACPKPLFVEDRSGGNWSFPFLLRDEAKLFSDALFQSISIVNVFEVVGVECMALLVSPIMDFDDFLDLVRYQQKYVASKQREAKRQGKYCLVVDFNALARVDSPVRLAYEAVREVLSLEDRIEGTWNSLRSLPIFRVESETTSSTATSDPSRLYPVLRLPYKSCRAPTEDLAWFPPAAARLMELDVILTAFANTHLSVTSQPSKSFRTEMSAGRGSGSVGSAHGPCASPEDANDGGNVSLSPFQNTRGSRTHIPGSKQSSPFEQEEYAVNSLQFPSVTVWGEQQELMLQNVMTDGSVDKELSSPTLHSHQKQPSNSMILPSRGNNAEPDDYDTTAPSVGALADSGRQGLDPNQRKRSVTVAVVGHQEPSTSLSKEPGDLRRRVTHAGTMSALHLPTSPYSDLTSPFKEQDPAADKDIDAINTTTGEERVVNTTDRNIKEVDIFQARNVLRSELPVLHEERTIDSLQTASAEKSNASQNTNGPVDMERIEPSAADTPSAMLLKLSSPDDGLLSERSYSGSPTASSTPVHHHPILKQSSFASDSAGSHKRPSQIMRAASEGRNKTLSFDSIIDEDSGVQISANRPRNGSYEIIYQESPDERLRTEVVFQGTPSPQVSRKRAQSTPLHLLSMTQRNNIDTTTSAGRSSIPFSLALPIHNSTSLNALNSYNTTTADRSRLRSSGAEARLRSAPAFPARKIYRGRPGHSASPSHYRQRKNFSASRLFSARSSRGDDDEDDDTSHFMETFGMLDSLSKPFTRGESLAESQILHIALRSMKVDDSTVLEMAVRKIIVWWRLVAPRKKLLRRMALRDACREIVLDMADAVVLIAGTKQRRRRTLMRNGAAMKIQRCFRHYCATILVEERRKQMAQRRAVAWKALGELCDVVQVAIRIYRFIRYCHRRRASRRLIKVSAAFILRRTIEKYFTLRTLRKKLELQQQLYTKMKVTSMMSTGNTNLYREREIAVACIQKCYRAYMLYRQTLERQYFNIMGSKITYFFIRCIARRRVKLNKAKQLAATKIQTFLRGLHTRAKILQIVKSGLLLNALWRKHKSYVSLKSQLRRVDRPHTLIIHGIRNIAKKTINSNQMRFKISVWWHPLLHIVSQNDFNTIIQSKQPQFIYNSSTFYLVDTSEQRSNRRMSISQGLRKLSSILSPGSRRQSTLMAKPQASTTTSRGVFRYSQVLADRSSSISGSARSSIATVYNALVPRRVTGSVVLPHIAPTRTARNSTVVANSSSSGAVASGLDAIKTPTFARKESVELLRPSALAAQLDIIHSDDESDDDEAEEGEDKETAGGSALVASRSFLAKRMGLTSPDSGSNKDSESTNQGQTNGNEDKPQEKSSIRWRRLSNVVLNSPDLLLECGETGAECSKPDGDNNIDSGDAGSESNVSAKTNGPGLKKSPSSSTGSLFLRSTLNFMSLGANARKKSSLVEEPRMICHFEDVVVKIPGCHGNSVIKFEIFEGE